MESTVKTVCFKDNFVTSLNNRFMWWNLQKVQYLAEENQVWKQENITASPEILRIFIKFIK